MKTTPTTDDLDQDFDPNELEEAAQDDITPLEAPEVSPATETLTAWDEPMDLTGHEVPKAPLEDEINIAEQLVREGVDVADSELRVAAADSDSDE